MNFWDDQRIEVTVFLNLETTVLDVNLNYYNN